MNPVAGSPEIQPPNRSKAVFLGLLCAVVGWLCLWQYGLRWSSSAEVFWTGVLYALCVLPSIAFVGGHRFHIPFMPMWGVGFFMLFGIPMISAERQTDLGFTAEAAVVRALQLASIGAVACLTTFYTPLGKWLEPVIPAFRAPWNASRAPKAGLLLSVLGIAFQYMRETTTAFPELRQLVYVGSQLGVIGMITLYLLHLRGQLPRRLKFVLWGLILPAQFLIGLGTGAVYNALVILAPLLFCYCAERRRIPWLQMAVVVLVCFVPFSGFKGEFRSYAWYGEEGDIKITGSPLQRGFAFVELVSKRLTEGGVEAYTVAAEYAHARVSHLDVLITVMDSTPSVIPYWKGETYKSLLWTFVPRFLYPQKPTRGLGQLFGHRYGLLHEEDTSTSYNVPYQVIEMYINFGSLGVLIGMALVGLVFRALALVVSRSQSGERSLIVGCTVLAGLLNMDSDFSLVMGNLIYYIPIFYIATRTFVHKAPQARAA